MFPGAAESHATARPGRTGVTEVTAALPATPAATSVMADTRNQCWTPLLRPATLYVVDVEPVFGVSTVNPVVALVVDCSMR